MKRVVSAIGMAILVIVVGVYHGKQQTTRPADDLVSNMPSVQSRILDYDYQKANEALSTEPVPTVHPWNVWAAQYPASQPPEGSVWWVLELDGTQTTVWMPEAMARWAVPVWLGCEIKDIIQTPYAIPGDAVGAAGERGQSQLHPIHAVGMAKQGLLFDSEHDKLLYAQQLWKRSGGEPWSCR